MIRWTCDTLGIMSKMTGKFRFVVHENVETNSEGLAKLISSIDPSGKWLVGVSDFFQWQRTNRSSGSANNGITTSVLKEIRKKIRRLNINNFFCWGKWGCDWQSRNSSRSRKCKITNFVPGLLSSNQFHQPGKSELEIVRECQLAMGEGKPGINELL